MSKSILITGASSGIGRAVAELFLSEGWQVGLLARQAEKLAEVAGGHAGAHILPADVTDPAAVDHAVNAFAMTAGHLNVLFNNAGIFTPPGTIDEIPLEDWFASVNVNLTGMYLAARAAFRQMRHQVPQGGRIINNGSIAAHVPRPRSAPYAATKAAVTGLTKSLSLDGRPFDIACGQIRHWQYPHADGGRPEQASRGSRSGWRADAHVCGGGCGNISAAYGQSAAGGKRAVHDGDGNPDALYRPRLKTRLCARPVLVPQGRFEPVRPDAASARSGPSLASFWSQKLLGELVGRPKGAGPSYRFLSRLNAAEAPQPAAMAIARDIRP